MGNGVAEPGNRTRFYWLMRPARCLTSRPLTDMTRWDATGSLPRICTTDVGTSALHIPLCRPQSTSIAIGRKSRSALPFPLFAQLLVGAANE